MGITYYIFKNTHYLIRIEQKVPLENIVHQTFRVMEEDLAEVVLVLGSY